MAFSVMISYRCWKSYSTQTNFKKSICSSYSNVLLFQSCVFILL